MVAGRWRFAKGITQPPLQCAVLLALFSLFPGCSFPDSNDSGTGEDENGDGGDVTFAVGGTYSLGTGVGGTGTMGEGGATGDCPGPSTVEIPAWGITNSGVYVKQGETVTISASGTWSVEGEETGPDGRNDECDRGLWVRVGKFFESECVGSSHELTVSRDGYLWFFQNTASVGYQQQAGSITVEISGGNSCSGIRPEGMLSVFEDPDFDLSRLDEFAPVCGDKVPVLFDTDSPDDPRIQDYVKNFMGGNPEAFMKKVITVACAVNYATPEEAAHHGNGSMRLVHYFGAEDFAGPKHVQDGKEYWDFALNFRVDDISSDHYGRWGGVPTTFLHETGHVLSPVGRVSGDVGMPRWLNETYADLLADKMGYYGLAHDNPQNWVLYSRTTPYCDGYGTGSLFLDSVNQKTPGFIHELSAYIVAQDPNPWAGSDAAFQAVLGRGIDDVYAEYLVDYNINELEKAVAECSFPNDTP